VVTGEDLGHLLVTCAQIPRNDSEGQRPSGPSAATAPTCFNKQGWSVCTSSFIKKGLYGAGERAGRRLRVEQAIAFGKACVSTRLILFDKVIVRRFLRAIAVPTILSSGWSSNRMRIDHPSEYFWINMGNVTKPSKFDPHNRGSAPLLLALAGRLPPTTSRPTRLRRFCTTRTRLRRQSAAGRPAGLADNNDD
jgi:hypothetical protein